MASAVTTVVQTVTSTVSATAASATSGDRAPAQGGVFEGYIPTTYDPKNPIALFVIQASIVIGLTRLLHWPLSKIRQPRVIAEVIAGVLLGPSVFGRIPGFTRHIFPTSSMPAFTLVANIGLVLFLFLVGLEVDLRFLVSNWKIALSVGTLGMILPFGMGVGIAYGLYHEFRTDAGIEPIGFGIYALFIGIALAITAFPVLCRILTSLKLLGTEVGIIVLSAGIGNDVVGWILLALCVTLVNSGAGLTALYIFLVSVGYALFLAYPVRISFMWILRRTKSLENGPTQGVVALTMFLVLASAFFTQIVGVHAIFGAFMVGLICPHEGGFAIKLTEKIEDLISVLFVPLYFALSGLSTNLGLLNDGTAWGYVVGITSIAFVGKIVGGTVASRLNGLVWRESLTIGCLMSCKGLVELIVLNIGYQAKILSQRTFTMFVVMALVTTVATTPLVTILYPPWYQEKLALWKAGKINWDGSPTSPHSETYHSAEPDSDAASRIMVYIRSDGLSSLFNVISLLTGSRQKTLKLTGQPSSEKAAESAGPSFQRPLRVHGIRLMELTERNSSVMKVTELEEYASRDPIIKAFGSSAYGTARDVTMSGQIAVVPDHSFANTLVQRAVNNRSDLLLLPWSETGSLSETPLTSENAVLPSTGDALSNKTYLALVNRVFEEASNTTNVGIYFDRSIIKTTVGDSATGSPILERPTRQLSRTATGLSVPDIHSVGLLFKSSDSYNHQQVRVLYRGHADDIFAVRLSLQLAQNGGVYVKIINQANESNSKQDALKNSEKQRDNTLQSTLDGITPITRPFVTVENTSAETGDVLSSLLLNAEDEVGDVTVIIGRGAPPMISTVQSSSQLLDKQSVLGDSTSKIINKMKELKLATNLLVIQSKALKVVPEERNLKDLGVSQESVTDL